MAAPKKNPLVAEITKAVNAYKTASAGLVRIYEKVIIEYWNEQAFSGYRNTELLIQLVNGLMDHPRVQAAVLRIAKTHGKFQIKTEGESKERTLKVVEWKNVKIDESEREAFRAEVLLFRSYQYTSMLNEQGEINRDFDQKAAREGLKKKALNFVAETILAAQAKGEEATAATAFSEVMAAIREVASDPEALVAALDDIRNAKAAKAEAKAEKEAKIAVAKEQIGEVFTAAE